jgi:hypothetical protein
MACGLLGTIKHFFVTLRLGEVKEWFCMQVLEEVVVCLPGHDEFLDPPPHVKWGWSYRGCMQFKALLFLHLVCPLPPPVLCSCMHSLWSLDPEREGGMLLRED